MDERTMSFNEGQLKRSGFGEAFNADLIDKMNHGVPVIQHPFSKEYDGDKVSAVLHLKKSATSDHYFLNKFELNLQKEAQLTQTSQTFYVNRKPSPATIDTDRRETLENRFTLKEAYNLLAGRPVFKNLVNNQGEEYQAWVKLNLKNKVDNGNHEIKQYTKNYGFNLDEVLSKYPIKELGNEEQKNQLFDSLHRGNLQKATFVGKDGGEERLYISPQISMSMLNVYDKEKQRLTTDVLVERQYIGNDLANNIKERIAMHDAKQGMSNSEDKSQGLSKGVSQNNESHSQANSEKKTESKNNDLSADEKKTQKQSGESSPKKQPKRQKVT